MFKRIFAVAAAASLSVLGATAAAQAQAQPHARPAGHLHGVRVVNLHRAFEAQLGHAKVGKISGIVYARGHRPKAAANTAATCTEPACPVAWQGGAGAAHPARVPAAVGPELVQPIPTRKRARTTWRTSSPGSATAGGMTTGPRSPHSTRTAPACPAFTGLGPSRAPFRTPARRPPAPPRPRSAAEADAFAASLASPTWPTRRSSWRPSREPARSGSTDAALAAPYADRLRLAQFLQRAVHQPAVPARRRYGLRSGLRQPTDGDQRRVQPGWRQRVRRHDHRSVADREYHRRSGLGRHGRQRVGRGDRRQVRVRAELQRRHARHRHGPATGSFADAVTVEQRGQRVRHVERRQRHHDLHQPGAPRSGTVGNNVNLQSRPPRRRQPAHLDSLPGCRRPEPSTRSPAPITGTPTAWREPSTSPCARWTRRARRSRCRSTGRSSGGSHRQADQG